MRESGVRSSTLDRRILFSRRAHFGHWATVGTLRKSVFRPSESELSICSILDLFLNEERREKGGMGLSLSSLHCFPRHFYLGRIISIFVFRDFLL